MGKKTSTKKSDSSKKSEGSVVDGEKTTENNHNNNGTVKKKKKTSKKSSKKEQPPTPENGITVEASPVSSKVKKTKKSKSSDLQKSNHSKAKGDTKKKKKKKSASSKASVDLSAHSDQREPQEDHHHLSPQETIPEVHEELYESKNGLNNGTKNGMSDEMINGTKNGMSTGIENGMNGEAPHEEDTSQTLRGEQRETSFNPALVQSSDEDTNELMPATNIVDTNMLMESHDQMNDSQVIDEGPPIGEIVATNDDDDNVSEIAEVITDDLGDPTVTANGDNVIYDPDDVDVCFDDRGHPGTKEWIKIVRECLDKFEEIDYSPPVYKAIKKKLKGRRFLMRTRRNERTYWREASKPEIIELFGECFNRERRRKLNGLTGDDSEVDSTLENSLGAGEEESLSVGDILMGKLRRTVHKEAAPAPKPLKVSPDVSGGAAAPLDTATTPKVSNQIPTSPRVKRSLSEGRLTDVQSSDRASRMNGRSDPTKRSLSQDDISRKILEKALAECRGAREFATPYDDVGLLQKGIAAEQKLTMLRSLAAAPSTFELKAGLEKLDDLAQRMKYASMAPMLDKLEKMERHMTEYFQTIAEQHSQASPPASLRKKVLLDPNNSRSSGERSGTSSTSGPSSNRISNPQAAFEGSMDTDDDIVNTEHSKMNRTVATDDDDGEAMHRRTIAISNGSLKSKGSKQSSVDSDFNPAELRRQILNGEDSPVDPINSPKFQHLSPKNVASRSPPLSSPASNALEIHQEVEVEADIVDSEDDYDVPLHGNERHHPPVKRTTGSTAATTNASSHDDIHDSGSIPPLSSGSTSRRSASLVSEIDDGDDYDMKQDYEEEVDDEDDAEVSARGGGEEPFDGGTISSEEGDENIDVDFNGNGNSDRVPVGDEYSAGLPSDDQYDDDQYNDDQQPGTYREEPLAGSSSFGEPSYREEALAGSDDDGSYEDEDVAYEQSLEGGSQDSYGLSEEERSYEEEVDDMGYEGSHSMGHDGRTRTYKEYQEEIDDDDDDEGSIPLRGGAAATDGKSDENSTSMRKGHVLELKPQTDDMSSVGRSMPGMYGSETEGEDYMGMGGEEGAYTEDSRSETSDSNTDVSSMVKPVHNDRPNPKIEQFFDRLQHFFEVRRKIEERADLMDPSDKFRNLKVRMHSGGIQKRTGKFKKEYQQHDLDDNIIGNLDDLYEAAEPALEELGRVLEQLVLDVKGMEKTSITLAPLKPRDRAYEKARQKYSQRQPGPPESWLYDVVRASILCKSYKQIWDVNKWLNKNVHIVQSKNRFNEPAFNGYRDLLFHVSIPYRDEMAHICEIQVHHKDMRVLDEQFGLPKHYEYFRSCFASPWRSQYQILDDLTMLNKYGEVGGQLMSKLLKSKDPNQLRLFAGLCREKLDEFDRALELYRRLLIMQQDAHGRDHVDVAATYLSIGLVLGGKGETDESLANLEKALEIQESLLGEDHIDVAETRSEIGHMLSKKGDFGGAIEQHRQALETRESIMGSEHVLIVRSLQDIGRALQEKGEFKASEAEYRRALKIQEDLIGEVHPDVASTRAMLGTTLCKHGDFKKAMEEHRLALSIRETRLNKNHPMTAQSHTDIGIILCQKGDYEVAEWRHRKALRIREAMRGKDDEECAVSLSHLGTVLLRKGDYDGAITEIKRAQTIRERNLGMDHPVTASSYIDLGNVYLEKGSYDLALKEFRRAKVVRESILGNMHPDTAVAYNCLGRALNLRGDHEASLVEHRKALAIFEQVLGEDHPMTATGYQCVADTLLAKDEKDEALIEHRKALAIRANVLAKDHPDTATSCSRIGNLLSEKGDSVGALVAYRQALAITVGLCGQDHPESASAHILVGRVLAAQGDLDEALEEFHQAAAIREAALQDHPDTGVAYSLLGTVWSMQGEFPKAEEMHEKALEILEQNFGKRHPYSEAVRTRLEMARREEVEMDL